MEQRLRTIATALLAALGEGGSEIEPRTVVKIGHIGDEILDGIAFEPLRAFACQAFFGRNFNPSGAQLPIAGLAGFVFVLLHHDFKDGQGGHTPNIQSDLNGWVDAGLTFVVIQDAQWRASGGRQPSHRVFHGGFFHAHFTIGVQQAPEVLGTPCVSVTFQPISDLLNASAEVLPRSGGRHRSGNRGEEQEE